MLTCHRTPHRFCSFWISQLPAEDLVAVALPKGGQGQGSFHSHAKACLTWVSSSSPPPNGGTRWGVIGIKMAHIPLSQLSLFLLSLSIFFQSFQKGAPCDYLFLLLYPQHLASWLAHTNIRWRTECFHRGPLPFPGPQSPTVTSLLRTPSIWVFGKSFVIHSHCW